MGKEHKEISEITKRVKKRLQSEITELQSGGAGLRQNNFSNSGNFGNMITQLSYFIENSVAGIVDGIYAVYSVEQIPGDLNHILGKKNEPLPSNTLISRILSPP
jgi:phage-related protein